MLNKINNATTKDELKLLIGVIKSDITIYSYNDLIKIDDAIKRREIILNLILQERILELRDISQDFFDRKEYQVSEVFTELAEDYKKELNIKL